MLMARLIPVLLVDRAKRVVKTVRFAERTYVGDPFNIIRLFNEKQVDEICLLDIDATTDLRDPDFDFVEAFAAECFMPLSYGGGVSSLAHARRLIALGVEKVILRSHTQEALIAAIANEFGAQAVVACLDYRHMEGRRVLAGNGQPLEEAARQAERAGAGELILQSIERDGTRTGMDIETISAIAGSVGVPVVALGGAGGLDHLQSAIAAGADAAASGSAFAFIGRMRAVLITYPEYSERQRAAHS